MSGLVEQRKDLQNQGYFPEFGRIAKGLGKIERLIRELPRRLDLLDPGDPQSAHVYLKMADQTGRTIRGLREAQEILETQREDMAGVLQSDAARVNLLYGGVRRLANQGHLSSDHAEKGEKAYQILCEVNPFIVGFEKRVNNPDPFISPLEAAVMSILIADDYLNRQNAGLSPDLLRIMGKLCSHIPSDGSAIVSAHSLHNVKQGLVEKFLSAGQMVNDLESCDVKDLIGWMNIGIDNKEELLRIILEKDEFSDDLHGLDLKGEFRQLLQQAYIRHTREAVRDEQRRVIPVEVVASNGKTEESLAEVQPLSKEDSEVIRWFAAAVRSNDAVVMQDLKQAQELADQERLALNTEFQVDRVLALLNLTRFRDKEKSYTLGELLTFKEEVKRALKRKPRKLPL